MVSASDRPISNQEELWKLHDIQVDFVALKHKLPELKERFEPDECLHVGDTEMDRFFAAQAGFDFLLIHEVPEDGSHLWMLQEESTDDADFAERRGVESQSVSSAQSVE